MAYCKQCGAELEEGAALAAQARFSAVCLAAVQWKPTVLPPVD